MRLHRRWTAPVIGDVSGDAIEIAEKIGPGLLGALPHLTDIIGSALCEAISAVRSRDAVTICDPLG
jgi:hypothetical protein